jgi:DnaJ-class molecular chaperone
MSDTDDRKRPASKRAPRTAAAEAPGDEGDSASEEAISDRPQPCIPCHGSGKVISNLDGRSRKVTCPWCRGGGVRILGADAQEYQQEQVGPKRP